MAVGSGSGLTAPGRPPRPAAPTPAAGVLPRPPGCSRPSGRCSTPRARKHRKVSLVPPGEFRKSISTCQVSARSPASSANPRRAQSHAVSLCVSSRPAEVRRGTAHGVPVLADQEHRSCSSSAITPTAPGCTTRSRVTAWAPIRTSSGTHRPTRRRRTARESRRPHGDS